MILAKNGIIPPKEWIANTSLENMINQDIKRNLQLGLLPIPTHWGNNDLDIFD